MPAPDDPSPPGGSRPPRQPALRPGARVAVRDQAHLQVGVDPPRRVLLPRTPDVARLLDDLANRRPPRITTPAAAQALTALAAQGLLVDGAQLAADLAGAASPSTVLAAYAHGGDAAAQRLRARREFAVAVEAPESVLPVAVRLLRELGCRTATAEQGADARLVVCPAPTLAADPGLRDGVPHLVVAATAEGGVRIGPLVVPGLTACLQCIEAHRAEHDPRRALVVQQAGRSAAGSRDPEPVDPCLLVMAVAWAVRDLAALAGGSRPTTWSASLVVEAEGLPGCQTWTRHPHCGCAWDELRTA